MKKSTLFLLTIQTTFVVIAVVAAITIYRSNQADSAQVTLSPTSSNPELVASPISPEQAAQVAAAYLGKSDLYKVEFAILNGVNAYQVTFSSGEWVYISQSGKVLPVIVSPAASSPGSSDSGSSH